MVGIFFQHCISGIQVSSIQWINHPLGLQHSLLSGRKGRKKSREAQSRGSTHLFCSPSNGESSHWWKHMASSGYKGYLKMQTLTGDTLPAPTSFCGDRGTDVQKISSSFCHTAFLDSQLPSLKNFPHLPVVFPEIRQNAAMIFISLGSFKWQIYKGSDHILFSLELYIMWPYS